MEFETKVIARLTKADVQEIIANYLNETHQIENYHVKFKAETIKFIVESGNGDYGDLVGVEGVAT